MGNLTKATKNKIIFLEKCAKLYGDKYDYSLVDYKRIDVRVDVVCKTHGVFSVLPYTHVLGTECSECKNGGEVVRLVGIKPESNSRLNKKTGRPKELLGKTLTNELVEKYTNNEYSFLSEGVKYTAHSKILFRHNTCEKEFFSSSTSFKSGARCPHCFQSKKKTIEILQQDFDDLSDGTYEIQSTEYINNKTKVEVLHTVCDNVYSVKPTYFISNGNRCPHCNIRSSVSNPVKMLTSFLKDNNVEFIRELRIPECRKVRPLPFDFAIKLNDTTTILIEYDGEQHFDESSTWKSRVEETDSIKDKFCADNSDTYKLHRIHYKENHITKLKEILISYGLLQGDL